MPSSPTISTPLLQNLLQRPPGDPEVSESDLYDLTDPEVMRERIQERSLKALEGRFPLEDDFYRLEASNFRLDPKRSRFGIQDVKNAILRGETLRTPVQADLALIDKSTNKVLDTKKGKTLAAVPYLTHRNTFVMRGTEYIVANQERLKPGVYTRLRNNGLLEAHGNVRPGTGKKFKMHMDPATGVFSLDLDKSKIRLYGVLKALGVSDEEMRREWGEEIWKINSDPKQADKARLKAWEKLGGPKYGQPDPTPRLASAEIPEMQEEEQESPEVPELAGGEQKIAYGGEDDEAIWERTPMVYQSGLGEREAERLLTPEAHLSIFERANELAKSDGSEIWVSLDDEVGDEHMPYQEYRKKLPGMMKKMKDPYEVVPWGYTAWHGKTYRGDYYIDRAYDEWLAAQKGKPLPTDEKYKDYTNEAVRRWQERKVASDNLLQPPEPKKPQAQDLVSSPGNDKDPDYDSYLREVFGRMEFDPEVSWRNLGKAYNNGGGGLLLDTSSKLLNISRGQAEPDDQSALYNKTFHTPDDFFEERVSRDAGRLSKALLFRLRKKPSLDSIPSGWFTPQLEGVVLKNSTSTGAPVSQAIPGINIVELLDTRLKIVPTGERGIGSYDAVPQEARDVHPTHIGFYDYIKTPESIAVGIDQRIAAGVRKGPNNTLYVPMRDRKSGKTIWRTPGHLYGKTVRFPERTKISA